MKKIYLFLLTALLFFCSFGIEEAEANTWADYTKGSELAAQGSYDKAIPYLKRAAEESGNASYYRKLAETYEADGQYQKAADTLYAEAAIRYKIGIKTGDMNTYHAVMGMADKLNSELEVYVEEPVEPVVTNSLAKYEPKSGLYVGAFIDGDEPLKPYKLEERYPKFEEWTNKDHATFFRYWKYGEPFPESWAKNVKAAGAAMHIALEPGSGLDEVKDNAYLRTFARKAAETNTPIFLRFAGEMNGNWVTWNGDPQKYIEAFRTVSRVMADEAENVAMVWSPGANPKHTINDYYPGDSFVDWVGVSIYSVRFFNGNVNDSAEHVNPLDSVDYIYQEYADRKPIMISEYGATTFSKAGSLDTTEFAITKMKMLYHGVKLKYPRVKSIQWFSLNTLINSHSADRKLNNYSLTENIRLLSAYSELVQDPYYLEEVVNGPSAKPESSHKGDVVPLKNEIIRKPVTIYAWAKTYDPNISKVIFKLNGKYRGERTSYPFSLDINPAAMADGRQELEVFVFDSKGRKAIEKSTVFMTGETPNPASNEIVLYIGDPKAYTDNNAVRLLTTPQIKDGRTLVPLRFISENLGADVKWNGEDKSITIEDNGRTLRLVLNQKYATVNGVKVSLDTSPIAVRGTTMVPIRFVTEQLQAGIAYKNDVKRITITP